MSEENLNNYVENLKKLIEDKFAIKIPESWLYPVILEDFCGYNDLRKEQEEIWKSYLTEYERTPRRFNLKEQKGIE